MTATPTPIDPKSMRLHNLALVLRTVADGDGVSRARIAAITGLNKTTVSSLVADLIDRGLVREAGITQRGGVGRPGVTVVLDGESFVALGLEINVDHMAFTAVDLLGRVRDEGFVRRDSRGRAAGDTLASLALLLRQALERLRNSGLRPVGAVLGLPGLVDPAQGLLLVAPNLGWHDVPVVAQLREALDEPDLDIRVENEANLGALAECWEGLGRSIDDFVYVSGYIGVGAGLIIGGKLHRGATGFGGEFGHMTLVADGPRCSCGSRGCVEALVGLEALLRRAGLEPDGPGRSTPTSATSPVTRLVEAAAAGEPRVVRALADVGAHLGAGFASAVNLVGCNAVVLGGYFASLHPWLREPIERELADRVLSSAWVPVEVGRSQLPGDAAVRGAALLSLRAMLDDPGRVTPVAPGARGDAG
jgi:predicted NBD/HSP70 family sugar kinase